MFGFWKKKNKKRVIVGASVIFEYLQQSIDMLQSNDMDMEDYLVVLFEEKQYTIGLSNDFKLAKEIKDKETENLRNVFFYFDNREFETFEHLKADVNFDGQPLAEIQGGIEVLEACALPPHNFIIFENYVIEEADCRKVDFTVKNEKFVFNLGLGGSLFILFIIVLITILEDELPHLIFYIFFGLLVLIGFGLMMTRVFKVTVKGSRINIRRTLGFKLSFDVSDITSVKRVAGGNELLATDSLFIRTNRGKKLKLDNMMLNYKKMHDFLISNEIEIEFVDKRRYSKQETDSFKSSPDNSEEIDR